MTSNIETITPKNGSEWRKWLQENHMAKQSVWVVYYKKKSNIETISWGDAVDEALCFGWIDSKKQTIDEEKYMQFFSKRKAKSTWSKINKTKIVRLIESNLMAQAGINSVEVAKSNGSWKILDEVEELIIPKDLESEFKNQNGSKEYFVSLSKSVRKGILQWVILAKRESTRLKRVKEIAELAAKKLKPKQFR